MKLKALNIPDKIKIKMMPEILSFDVIYQSNYEIVFRIDTDTYFIMYSFGAMVFVDVPPAIEKKIRTKIKKLIPGDPFIEEYIIEHCDINKVYDKKVVVKSLDLEYIRFVSLALAESVNLDSIEDLIETMLGQSLAYSQALKVSGKYPTSNTELLKFIGFCITTKQEIHSNLYISSVPEEAWENKDLERLFLQLKDMFDIESRYQSISRSLSAIQESNQVLVDLMNVKHSVKLEWAIILLFLLEIVINLVEKLI